MAGRGGGEDYACVRGGKGLLNFFVALASIRLSVSRLDHGQTFVVSFDFSLRSDDDDAAGQNAAGVSHSSARSTHLLLPAASLSFSTTTALSHHVRR
jgi:hypothetical protein